MRLDIRGLAIMRIALGCLVLRDLITIASSLSAFVGDTSIMPPAIALSDYLQWNYWSIHTISGAHWWGVVLMIVHMLFAVCYIIGFKTKYVAPMLWFLTCSLQGSHHLILHGGDVVARLLLWWSLFLPISTVYSIDALSNPSKPSHYSFSNIASLGLILQMGQIYFRSYILKTSPLRRIDFTAIYYSLNIDYYSTNIGQFLHQFPTIMKGLTAYVLYLEFLGPLLYLIPKQKVKIIICFLFMLFSIGLSLTMRLGLFPWYCFVGWIGLLPTSFWDWLVARPIMIQIITYCTSKASWIRNKVIKNNWIRNNLKLYTPAPQQPTNSKSTPLSALHRTTTIFLSLVVVYIFMRNIRSTNMETWKGYFPASIDRFAYLLRIDQYRGMFAPSPSLTNGRHQINGLTWYGNKVINLSDPSQDPFQNKPTHKQIVDILPNSKRTRLLLTLNGEGYAKYRQYYARYRCDKRNKHHSDADQIKAVQISYMQENTEADYKTGSITALYMGTWDCEKHTN